MLVAGWRKSGKGDDWATRRWGRSGAVIIEVWPGVVLRMGGNEKMLCLEMGQEQSFLAEQRARDIRYCRTHALIADLFAKRPSHCSNAEIWTYVAEAWAELAALKERARQ